MAHFAFDLVSRLPLHSFGRQPRVRGALVSESDGRVRGKWSLARRELDVCHLGSIARRLLDLRPGHQGCSRADGTADTAGSGTNASQRVEADRRLSVGLLRLDFFRAESLSDAFTIVSRLPMGWEQLASVDLLEVAREQIGASERYLLTALLLIVLLTVVEGLPKAAGGNVMELVARQHWVVRWGAYTGLVLAILNLQVSTTTPFIYFQF